MGANSKPVAIALLGVGALAAATLSGSARAESQAVATEPKAKALPSRIALAQKYAKLFGVPVSLVLATIYAQSKNQANAKRSNNRGGAWGYGQMTLATAKEIWPKVKGKIGLTWDGTGQGLLNPSLNIALTAAFLGTWWARYKRNPRNWMLTAYAYVLGPGKVRQLMPKDDGTLPKTLPADFKRVKDAYAKALLTNDVKAAIKTEGTIPGLGAEYKGSDPLVWTPSAVRGEFDRIRRVLDTINMEASQAVKDNKMSGDEWSQWFNTYNTGHKFVDTASVYWGSNVLTARQHEQEAAKWRDLIKSRGAKLTGPQELVRSPDKPLMDQLTAPGFNKLSAAIAVAGVVGVGFLVLAIKK